MDELLEAWVRHPHATGACRDSTNGHSWKIQDNEMAYCEDFVECVLCGMCGVSSFDAVPVVYWPAT